jgi:glutamyl-tRNA reductase
MGAQTQAGGFRLALVGCNHRSATVEVRERMVFTPEQALHAADELCLKGIVEEAVILSTCNRSEVYGVANGSSGEAHEALAEFLTAFHGLRPDEINGRIYRHSGADAAQHLFRVAAGLDSMLLGEAEILGQVREAYGKALEHGTTGPVLNRLFQSALEVGKRVRSETELGTRPVSVAYAGVKLAESVFGELKGHRALIVGAGAVAEQVIVRLRQRGIGELRIVNRSPERAGELARRYAAEAAGWDFLESLMSWADVIVTSVSGGATVVDRATLEGVMAAREGRAVFVVDLGVPRNVDGQARDVYNAYVYNVDDLGEIVERNRHAREAEIPRAEALVEEQIRKFDAWRNSVEALTLIEKLRRRLHDERRAFLQEHQSALAHLPPAERQEMELLTQELVDHLLKGPASRLRHARSLRERVEEAEMLRELFAADEDKK